MPEKRMIRAAAVVLVCAVLYVITAVVLVSTCGVEIPCYVLEDERRVVTLSGIEGGLTLSLRGGAGRLAEFVGRIDPNSSNANELAVQLDAPIKFRLPRGGKPAFGYEHAPIVRPGADSGSPGRNPE